MNYYDRAREVYEQAMEVIHGHVGNVMDDVEELSELVEELVSEKSRDRADELISKILISLDKI